MQTLWTDSGYLLLKTLLQSVKSRLLFFFLPQSRMASSLKFFIKWRNRTVYANKWCLVTWGLADVTEYSKIITVVLLEALPAQLPYAMLLLDWTMYFGFFRPLKPAFLQVFNALKSTVHQPFISVSPTCLLDECTESSRYIAGWLVMAV